VKQYEAIAHPPVSLHPMCSCCPYAQGVHKELRRGVGVCALQDLKARQEPSSKVVERYSNLHKHQQQEVHGNRKALFWCESRHFEATHVIPQLLTSSAHEHVHTAHTDDPELANRSTEAERLGAVGGAVGGAGTGSAANGGVVPMPGLRKRTCTQRASVANACDKSAGRKRARSTDRAGICGTEDSRKDGSQDGSMGTMHGDAGEVWVNAFVVGEGENRQVRAGMPLEGNTFTSSS
jgi:hypothetical protein